MLFLGCGDLRNPLKTAVCSSPGKKIHLHINDYNLPVIGRNVLILMIASSSNKFNPENQEDMNYIWDVWYNATWPESTLKRFVGDLRCLLDDEVALPNNIIISESSHNALKALWAKWITMANTLSAEDVLFDRYMLR